jgi:hypothetical protein
MLIIEIRHETTEMLGELNNGIVPVVEFEGSYFIYHGKDTPPEIISVTEALTRGYLQNARIEDRSFPIRYKK